MKEILVIGDSHTPIFNHPFFEKSFPEYHFNVVSVIGATASGLENPNTKTQAYPIFKDALKHSLAEKIIVMLGEVDTGFVIWYRAKKYQESVSAMMNKAIASYSKFLLEVSEHSDLICISTPLPTIQDDNDWGEVANLRSEITATQIERTHLTLAFNQQIKLFCKKQGITYIMLDYESMGDGKIVRNDLLNADLKDHHYDPNTYSELLVSHLRSII